MFSSPLTVLEVIQRDDFGVNYDILEDFIPTKDQYDEVLYSVPLNPLDVCLTVVDPLVPPKSTWKKENLATPSYDLIGLSEYARLVNALLQVLINDRQKARENLWALRHFIILANAISAGLNLPDAENCVFSKTASHTFLEAIVAQIQRMTTLLLIAPTSDTWHLTLTQKNLRLLDPLGEFVSSAVEKSKTTDSYRDSAALYTILRHILKGATRDDANSWLSLARKAEKQGT